jgi:hypothetical protein
MKVTVDADEPPSNLMRLGIGLISGAHPLSLERVCSAVQHHYGCGILLTLPNDPGVLPVKRQLMSA